MRPVCVVSHLLSSSSRRRACWMAERAPSTAERRPAPDAAGHRGGWAMGDSTWRQWCQAAIDWLMSHACVCSSRSPRGEIPPRAVGRHLTPPGRAESRGPGPAAAHARGPMEKDNLAHARVYGGGRRIDNGEASRSVRVRDARCEASVRAVRRCRLRRVRAIEALSAWSSPPTGGSVPARVSRVWPWPPGSPPSVATPIRS